MNGIIIEKNLCLVGEEINRDLDELLAKQRIEPTSERNHEIHKLIKLYFRHRKECFDCQVQIRMR
jgi:hypothetical protein